MYSRKLLLGISCLIMTVSLTYISNAATQTGKLQVHLNIERSCKLDASDVNLDFGSESFLPEGKEVTTDEGKGIKITCTQNLPFTVGLDYGQHHSGSAEEGGRWLRNGKTDVRYSLYQGAGGQFWGDGTGGSEYLLSAVGKGSEVNYPVNGKIWPNGNTLEGGDYTDTVNIIVSY